MSTSLEIARRDDQLASVLTLLGHPVAGRASRPVNDTLLADIRRAMENALADGDLQAVFEHGGRLARLLGQNSNALAAQARNAAGGDMVLLLDERVAAIPFELIPVGSRLLGESCTIGRKVVTGPDWGEPAFRPRRLPHERARVLLVADSSLKWAVAEIQAIRRRLRRDTRFSAPELLIDPDPETLRANLAGVDILHFAGHGENGFQDPLQNGWKLRGGVFSAANIISSGIEQWPILVFANACPTSAGAHTRGGRLGVDAVAVSLLLQGVGHYISTVSPITDSRRSAVFALRFYEKLLGGFSVGGAMLAARERFTRSTKGRIAAAHYILYGEPSERVFPAPAAPKAVEAPAGAQLGGFRLLGKAGEDDYRTLYRASAGASGLPAEVLIAVPHDQRERVVREQLAAFLELAPKLKRPGLTPILDAAIIDGRLAVVYEPLAGEPLDISAARTPSEGAKAVGAIAEALGQAHAAGVVHDGLTPSSIYIDPASGQVRLMDAGLADVRRRAGLRHRHPDPAYRSPEQWATPASRSGVSSDLWALAVITFQLLAHKHPFEDAFRDKGAWREVVLEGTVELPDPLPPGLTAATAVFLRRALARAPMDRYRTAGDFAAAFRRALEGGGRVGGFDPDLEAALDTRAGVLFVATDDEEDTVARLHDIASRRHLEFRLWSVTSGLHGAPGDPPGPYMGDPHGIIGWLESQASPVMLVLLDFDAFLDDWQLGTNQEQPFREFRGAASVDDMWSPLSAVPDAQDRPAQPGSMLAFPKAEIRRAVMNFENSRRRGSGPPHKMVISAPRFILPPEMVKCVHRFSALPASRADVDEILRLEGSAGETWGETFAWHAAGLTRSSIRSALRLSRIRHGRLDENCLHDLTREKAQLVRRSGVLEYIEPRYTISRDVIGMDLFRIWFGLRRHTLTDPALAGALPPAQGVVLGGIAGCGKSLCAEAIAGELQWPLLRLDMGRVFTGRLGAAEENLREALALAELMSPLVLWVEDIDRGLAAGPISRGGVSGRVLATLLTWLQDRPGGAFVAATMADPVGLPPEVVRAGRFERTFYFAWPTSAERSDLIRHCLEAWGRSVDGHDFAALARGCEYLSGADIAGRVGEALYNAAAAGRKDPSQADLEAALFTNPIPQAKRRDLEMERLKWSMVAVPGSLPELAGNGSPGRFEQGVNYEQ